METGGLINISPAAEKQRVVLISTYEMGRQPFGLASPAAWLRNEGALVSCLDLSREALDESAIQHANLIAFYLPMHTATRLAVPVIANVRRLNPNAHLCAFGLYAPVNAEFLRKCGVHTVIGGEFEEQLLNLVRRLGQNAEFGREDEQPFQKISLGRQKFVVPERRGLPTLPSYAQLVVPDGTRRTVGYTEASRGCKHLCRHCPIVPVYKGNFRIVQRDVVTADIRQQVAAGAQHITFGDPDFFNGVRHAAEIVRALHQEFPQLSYDVTIKVEHLLKHADHLPLLRDTGCAFVVSAVESLDDKVLLSVFDKGHTREDFVKVVSLFQELGLVLVPTFVAFHPWITLEGYEDLLATLANLNLVDHVAPIQLAIRLLIPAESRLLELPEVRLIVSGFDDAALSYRWSHPDSRVDLLQHELELMVHQKTKMGFGRRAIFNEAWQTLYRVMRGSHAAVPAIPPGQPRVTVPYLTEPWYC